MRTAVASLVTVVLLSLFAVCPLTACVLALNSDTAHRGCCHKSGPQPTHCPLPTVQDCPYFILEKGKIIQAGAAVSVNVSQPVTPDFRVPDRLTGLRYETRLQDSADLYLRVRVLLI
jgi:hypothetical protein